MGLTPREFREKCNAREHHMFWTFIQVRAQEHEAEQRANEEYQSDVPSYDDSGGLGADDDASSYSPPPGYPNG